MRIFNWLKRTAGMADWEKVLYRNLVGNKGSTGINVNETNALAITTVFACVKIIAETIASLPLHTYQRLERGKQKAIDLDLYYLLHDQPNPEMHSFNFWEALVGHLLTWGNAYAEIQWNEKTGKVLALWPLRPDLMEVKRENGQLYYLYSLPYNLNYQKHEKKRFEPYQIFHIAGFGYDGLVGYSPIRLHKEAIGLAAATEKYGGTFFGNGARPSGVLELDSVLKDDARNRLKKDWNEIHQGLDNGHRIAILEQGMHYKQIGIPPEDAQFLQTRKFQIAEIARIYRMQLHKLQEMDRATFSNIEQQSIEHVVDTIRPWTVRIEKTIKMKLFGPAEKRIYFSEFLLDGLLRGDTQSRYQSYSISRQWGWMSANDIRELENMNPLKEGGDMYLVPMNMMDAAKPIEVIEPKKEPVKEPEAKTNNRNIDSLEMRSVKARNRLAQRFEKLFIDAGARIVKREVSDIRRALKKSDLKEFKRWLDEFYEKAPEWISRSIKPVIYSYSESIQEEAADELGQEYNSNDIKTFVNDYIDVFSSRYTSSSKGQLLSLLKEKNQRAEEDEEYFDEIEERLGEWEEKRPSKIAMNETIRAGAAFALATYAYFGITKKRWVTNGKNCPFCDSMNGRVIEITKDFFDANDEFSPEGAQSTLTFRNAIGHPPIHQGCNCGIVAESSVRNTLTDEEKRTVFTKLLDLAMNETADHKCTCEH